MRRRLPKTRGSLGVAKHAQVLIGRNRFRDSMLGSIFKYESRILGMAGVPGHVGGMADTVSDDEVTVVALPSEWGTDPSTPSWGPILDMEGTADMEAMRKAWASMETLDAIAEGTGIVPSIDEVKPRPAWLADDEEEGDPDEDLFPANPGRPMAMGRTSHVRHYPPKEDS